MRQLPKKKGTTIFCHSLCDCRAILGYNYKYLGTFVSNNSFLSFKKCSCTIALVLTKWHRDITIFFCGKKPRKSVPKISMKNYRTLCVKKYHSVNTSFTTYKWFREYYYYILKRCCCCALHTHNLELFMDVNYVCRGGVCSTKVV